MVDKETEIEEIELICFGMQKYAFWKVVIRL